MIKNKLVHYLLTFVVLIYIVFEELIWERFAQPLIRYFNSLKILSKLEKTLLKVNSKVILVIFVAMFVSVEFLGVYAGTLFVQGKILHGALLYAGKIPIAAFTFWLFRVSRKKLLEFGWFKTIYYFIIGMIEKITHSEIYTNIKAKSAKIKAYIKSNFFQEEGLIKRKIAVIYKTLKKLSSK